MLGSQSLGTWWMVNMILHTHPGILMLFSSLFLNTETDQAFSYWLNNDLILSGT